MTEAYPLRWPDGWPRKRTGHMGFNNFGVTPEKGYLGLITELRKLGATQIVVSSNLPVSKRSGAPLLSEDGGGMDWGVAVYFTLNGQQMVMAQDVYNRVWANMRSLTLAVAAMRSLERHGGGHMMQRAFDGFAALPPPEYGGQGHQKKPWRTVLNLAEIPGLEKADILVLAENRYKVLARANHPDSGGSAETMAELNIAIDDARKELS